GGGSNRASFGVNSPRYRGDHHRQEQIGNRTLADPLFSATPPLKMAGAGRSTQSHGQAPDEEHHEDRSDNHVDAAEKAEQIATACASKSMTAATGLAAASARRNLPAW